MTQVGRQALWVNRRLLCGMAIGAQWAALLAMCLAAGDVGPVELLKDIYQAASPQYSSPTRFVLLDGRVYFAATTVTTGQELFGSDGTPEGTELVKDVWPGPSGGMAGSTAPPIEFEGELYFTANDGAHGTELWKTDGTAEGTVLVKDTWPGPSGNCGSPVVAGGQLFFTADDGTTGAELWRSDGTEAGTALVLVINPGTSAPSIGNMTAAGGLLFFTANDGTHGAELWRSDGTAAGTMLTLDIRAGSVASNIGNVTAAGGILLFSANDNVNGAELWRSDGSTAGTAMVANINPGANAGSGPASFRMCGGILYFSANDGSRGSELWRSDGTSAGTWLVKDIRPGGATSSSGPTAPIDAGGRLMFLANDGSTGTEPWISDGTSGGTMLVKDIYPGSQTSNCQNQAWLNGLLYFSATNGTNGVELWRSDGTSAGTILLGDLNPGSSGSNPKFIQATSNGVVFQATVTATGTEIYRTDGTAGNTALLRDIQTGPLSGNPRQTVSLGGKAWFIANDGPTGDEPWVSDGTAAGTMLVANINPDLGSSNPAEFTAFGDRVFFSARDTTNGTELWWTEGTETSTAVFLDIAAGSDSGTPQHFASRLGRLFFSAVRPTEGREPWVSDGTVDGTFLLADTAPGTMTNGFAFPSIPSNFLEFGGQVCFTSLTSAYDSWGYIVHRVELWKTDGTKAGTSMVRRISADADWKEPRMTSAQGLLFILYYPYGTFTCELWKSDGTSAGCAKLGTFDSYSGMGLSPPFFCEAGGTLFVAPVCDYSYKYGNELWKTDGTAKGTVMVKDISPGYQGAGVPKHSNPFGLTAMGGKVYFAATSPTGRELWVSDGTESGTVEVKDIEPGSASSNPTVFGAVGGRLFFSAADQAHGSELWLSDGTADGTVLVTDIVEGATGALTDTYSWAVLPDDLGLVFTACDPEHGQELWVSDGSARNTCRISELVEGAGSGVFSQFAIANGRLYFRGYDCVTGHEPWSAALSDLGRVASIDVKPGSDVNPINRKSKGSIPVAILSSQDFDAVLDVDVDSLTFGRTGFEDSLLRAGGTDGSGPDESESPSGEDVDGDGDLDLVCHFASQATGFESGDTTGILRGHTKAGAILRGTDSVLILK